MASEADDLFNDALSLPPAERAALAEKLLESLITPDQTEIEIDAAWAEEAQRRLEAYDRGALKAIPEEEVFRSLANRKRP